VGNDESLENRYFLVVDDEPFVRNLVARFLRQSGAAGVVEAASGSEALAAIASYEMTFSAVISDIDMPATNGLQLLQAIRTGAGGLRRNTAFVLLTAHADGNLVSRALQLDADAFVLKPVGRDEITERVLRVVERRVAIRPSEEYAALDVPSDLSAIADEPAVLPAALPAGAKTLRLGLVAANSILAVDLAGADGQRLLGARTVLTRSLLARLDDLRRIHPTVRELSVFEPDVAHAS
jgi:DNA-binding NarL/FixJ family response regulator